MHNYSLNSPLFKSRSHTTFWSGVNSKGVSTGTLKWRMESKANKSPLLSSLSSTSPKSSSLVQQSLFNIRHCPHTDTHLFYVLMIAYKEVSSHFIPSRIEGDRIKVLLLTFGNKQRYFGGVISTEWINISIGISASQYNKLNLFTHNLIDYSCILNQKQRDIWLCKPLIIFLANDQEELIKLLKGRVTRYLVIV